MKVLLSIFILLSSITAFTQKNPCAASDLPRVIIPAYLKGLNIGETLLVPKEYFKNGVELISANPKAKIVGYVVIRDCPSHDFYPFPVCGARMDSTTFKKFIELLNYPDNVTQYWFDSITIDIEEHRYLAPDFTVIVR